MTDVALKDLSSVFTPFKLRTVLFSGDSPSNHGCIVDIREFEVDLTKEGKFTATAQWAIMEMLAHLQSGKFALFEIIRKEG